MQKTNITSFVEFIKHTDILDFFADTVLFRGQPVQGNLLPSIARLDPKLNTTVKERSVLQQLRLQGASVIPGTDITDLDLMVLAQHYGLKTRLMDWTSNPLVALWFACNDARTGDVFVYALEADSLLIEDVYAQDPFDRESTKVFQPRLNNPRIVAQQGWFTLHRFASKNKKFVSLEKNAQISKHLHEFCIPEDKRAEIVRALDRHGVSSKTIFPDLPGLCQHLNWKHSL